MRSFLRLGRALCVEGVPKDIFMDFGTPLGEEGARFDVFRSLLGSSLVIFGTILVYLVICVADL